MASRRSGPSRKERRVLAAQSGTSAENLRQLAADPDRGTREAVAANAGTPADVLVSLVGDDSFDVRCAAVSNQAAGLPVQRAACASPDKNVRVVLAQQQGLPAEITAVLARDPVRQVREHLAECTDDPAVLRLLLTDPEPGVRACGAMNEGTTALQRQQLLRDARYEVRACVVGGMATNGWEIPEEDMLRLARDRSVNVRYAVASSPGSTRPVYEILAQDPDEMVAAAAGSWLLSSGDPAFPGNLPGRVLGNLAGRRRFPNPDQLGLPTTRLSDEDAYALMEALTGAADEILGRRASP